MTGAESLSPGTQPVTEIQSALSLSRRRCGVSPQKGVCRQRSADQGEGFPLITPLLMTPLRYAPSGTAPAHFLIDDRLNDGHIHLCSGRQTCDLGCNLGPMPEFGWVALRAAACRHTLRFIVSMTIMVQDHYTRVVLPALTKLLASTDPIRESTEHSVAID